MFLAMVMYPDAQKKAQQELDAVIGPDRLPEFSDRDSLPYLNAVVKEIIRWHTVVPLGVSHCVTEEDEYKGYRIPAGTILVPNAWYAAVMSTNGRYLVLKCASPGPCRATRKYIRTPTCSYPNGSWRTGSAAPTPGTRKSISSASAVGAS